MRCAGQDTVLRVSGKKWITVCLCTCRRPRQLATLLEKLAAQTTEDLFRISLSVVDNDEMLSGKSVIGAWGDRTGIPVTYQHCPDRNLAKLRNLSIEAATGDYIAFIDDDEYPCSEWLLLLLRAIEAYGASGALGPILPAYTVPPPSWLIKAKLNERVRFPTGTALDWRHTRTGNALFRKDLVSEPDNLFDLKFQLGAEDDAFFRKLIQKGNRFVWCDEAVVYEEVPPERMSLRYYQSRAELIGYMEYVYYRDERHNFRNVVAIAKSIVAWLAYTLLGPLARIRGFHAAARISQKKSYHRAFILTSIGRLRLEKRNI